MSAASIFAMLDIPDTLARWAIAFGMGTYLREVTGECSQHICNVEHARFNGHGKCTQPSTLSRNSSWHPVKIAMSPGIHSAPMESQAVLGMQTHLPPLCDHEQIPPHTHSPKSPPLHKSYHRAISPADGLQAFVAARRAQGLPSDALDSKGVHFCRFLF